MNVYMTQPPQKSGWHVHTNDTIYSSGMEMQTGTWLWSAWGPHGFQSGAEQNANTAAYKARSAADVLRAAREYEPKKNQT